MDWKNVGDVLLNIIKSIGISGLTLYTGFNWFIKKKIEARIDIGAKKALTKYEKEIEALNHEKFKQLELSNDLIIKKFEFDTYKKQIVLPELQKISTYIDEYKMLINSYDNSILNNIPNCTSYEKNRLSLDENLIESKGKIKIYLPNEFSNLLDRIRVIFSNSFQRSEILNKEFLDLGYNLKTPLDARYELLDRYFTSFIEMVRIYLSMENKNEKEYIEILFKNSLSKTAKIEKFETLTMEYVYKRMMLSEYYQPSEIVNIQFHIEEGIKDGIINK